MNPRSRKQNTPATREPVGQRAETPPKPAPLEHQNRGGERPSQERRPATRRMEEGGGGSRQEGSPHLSAGADRSGPPRHHHQGENGDENEAGGAGGGPPARPQRTSGVYSVASLRPVGGGCVGAQQREAEEAKPNGKCQDAPPARVLKDGRRGRLLNAGVRSDTAGPPCRVERDEWGGVGWCRGSGVSGRPIPAPRCRRPVARCQVGPAASWTIDFLACGARLVAVVPLSS
jgi:hypothetical protein